MAQIPANFLRAVVALGWVHPDQESQQHQEPMSPHSTGFLYAYPTEYRNEIPPDGTYLASVFLVTCKHVLDVQSQFNQLLIRFNNLDGQGMSTYSLDIRREGALIWTIHPTADIAVLRLSAPKLEAEGVGLHRIPKADGALPHERILEGDFSEGDEVFIAGFPIGWREGSQDYPVVRHGMVAQIRGLANRHHDTFLVDGSGFGGNSGGPVLTKAQPGSITGTSRIDRVYLVGMVSASTNIARSSDSGSEVREHADLIVVEPINRINETVELALDAHSSDRADQPTS